MCLPRFGSVFSGAYTPLHALLSPLIDAHALAHTPFTLKPIPILTHTFPGVVLAGGEQQWSGTGLFFSAGQSLARPKGGSHPIPPEVPLVWDPFETPPAGRTSL